MDVLCPTSMVVSVCDKVRLIYSLSISEIIVRAVRSVLTMAVL